MLPAPPGGAEPHWAELHVHTGFSFLRGASDPAELVAEAARLGVRTLAVTDRDGLYAARRLEEAASAAGVRTVFGAELSLSAQGLGTPVVLARTLDGYRRLSAELTRAQLAGSKGAPVYDLSALARAADHGDWAVLTGCPRREPADGDVDSAVRELWELAEVFGHGRLHAELIDHRLPEDTLRNHALFAAARRAGVKVVASGAVHYAAPGQARLAQALTALRRREDLRGAAGHLHPAPTAHLRSGGEMASWLGRFPGVREATLALGEECVLPLGELQPQLPGFAVPVGHSENSWLRRLVHDAATERYGPSPGGSAGSASQRAWRQLEHELGIINGLGMAGYFLIVQDIVAFARRADIWCQGRGSAASSLVCFVLGITGVDPLRHGLLFERFLSAERSEPPDIDIDFEHRRREEVISYVYERYGRRHAAQVANIITYRPRLAVRDAARALGYPAGRVDEMSRQVHHHQPPDAEAEVPQEVRELAGRLDRLPRHLGIHSAGMVLTRQPVGEFIPVEWATAEGRSVLQGDKDDVEAAGLVKIDLLALGMLSALHDACDLVARHHGARYDLSTIPQDDPEVYAMIARADTVGVFQVESRAQMSTLPRLRPRSFEDLVVAVSLIRPGPIQGGSVHPYMRRRAGREKVTYPHPLTERALKRSLGVPLWQEQMMELAMDCAGFSPAEADQLRKALSSKRSAERVGQLRGKLLRGMAAHGIGANTAEKIYTMIAGFSSYGFPQSHAQSMAHLVYASGWLKRYHPAAFTAALLRNQPMGFYSPLSLIGDARRHGVEVRPVDVSRSGVRDELESAVPHGPGAADTTGAPAPDPGTVHAHATGPVHAADAASGAAKQPAPEQPAIRLGLSHLRGLSEKAARTIVEGRPYSGPADFARRTGLPSGLLETLATAGAFESLGMERREAVWAVGPLSRADERTLPGTTPAPAAPGLPAMSVVEETFSDLWATGTSAEHHPIEHLREQLRSYGALPTAEVFGLRDRTEVVVGGLVTHRQRPPTAKGVVFLTLEDETGMTNVIVLPPVWNRYAKAALDHAAVLVHGRVERADGATNLLASRLAPLPTLTAFAAGGH
ncbi:error-prone DNA polymerase [Streptomyces sp. P38-E01]|uniref:Error-prone DNA polymerase n=1 Tax=Streptomyces tardus TaxID=2780544 RepID=A0A949N5M4_9ACTN|nr:error-prone DNA polymerase [Streptomyces tardus]MBU7599104.1 error-prone DNA polymerase [Streptomyces tardus]